MSEVLSSYTIDGVEITTYDDGHQTFVSVDEQVQNDKNSEVCSDNIFKRIWNWFNESKVVPYAKIRNLSDPLDRKDENDDGSGSKSGVEIGVKIRF